MPRKSTIPSRKRSTIPRKRIDLGDETTSSSNNDLASDIDSLEKRKSATRDEETKNSNNNDFDSAEERESATDYELEFTNSNIGGPCMIENQNRRLSQQPQDKPQIEVSDVGGPSSAPSVEHHSGALPVQQKPKTSSKSVIEKPQQKPRKQRNPQQREKIFRKDVMRLQATKNNLVPRLPFSRLVREILINTAVDATKITRTALEALQEASEMYLTQQLQDAYTLTLHRGRLTLSVKDMELLRYIRR